MNHPTLFTIHVWPELHQSSKVQIPKNATNEQLDKIMRERHERGWYIEQLTHYGPLGAMGCVEYVNSLAGN